ncbi:SNAP receptor [Malassezia psittaci]|uniref:SNAP receptor n=1 Tax=Malassezia psittaci TaxID=1821823 RepID=A0AAF0FBY8_9BASI|nr:SNAP receptor [Malassezia psittaci]
MSFNDLERGEGAGTPLEPRSRDSVSRAESPEFMRLTEQVGLQIFRINANVSTLEKLNLQLRNTPHAENESLRRQFNDLSEQTRSIVKDATDDVKTLSAIPVRTAGVAGSSPAAVMQSKLQRDFQHALFSFQAIQRSGIRKEKEALAYVKSQTEDTAPEQHGNLQMQTQIPRISQGELEYQESLIAEREAEIHEIEAGVQELNEIFRDLSHIVQEQGGMIDNIEYNITNISTNAQGADRELLQAHTYQRRAGRRTACLMIIIGFVVSVVLLALLA